MPRESPTIEQVLNMLAAAPSRLADLTEGLPPTQLLTLPSPVNGPQEMCLPICAPVLTCGATALL